LASLSGFLHVTMGIARFRSTRAKLLVSVDLFTTHLSRLVIR